MAFKSIITQIILFALVILLSIGLAESQLNRRQERITNNSLREALSSEMKTSKDKLGRETAKRQALEASQEDFLQVLAAKDSQLSRLQQVVKQAGKRVQHATVVGTETMVTAAAKSEITVVYADSGSCPQIAYSAFVGDEWMEGYITADRDSVKLNYLKIRNEFDIWQREERAGFLKARKPVVYFRSANPYTSVKELHSFTVKKRKPSLAGKILKVAVVALAVKGGVDIATR